MNPDDKLKGSAIVLCAECFTNDMLEKRRRLRRPARTAPGTMRGLGMLMSRPDLTDARRNRSVMVVRG